MRFLWSIAAHEPGLAKWLAGECGISTLQAQCLLNRGLREREDVNLFLRPRLANLADPFLLPNMESAVERLILARQGREVVVIFGDYDVDGVTSTALLTEVMDRLGWSVRYYLPHRLEDGYGLTRDGVAKCLEQHHPTLILAVDCGSTSSAVIQGLRSTGIDVIILDHHQVSDPLPPAVAIVNPQLGDSRSQVLCSAGLAFKLAHALVKRGRKLGWEAARAFDIRSLLDLVALGTVADVVPLRNENRILVSAGLNCLGSTKRPGLAALKAVAQITDPMGVYEIGFQLAPRLNAAGRLEDATQALRLLQSVSLAEAEPLAVALDARNRERQLIEQRILDEVLVGLKARFDSEKDFVIVEGNSLWHVGVVGIVASRVLREYHRPVIIVGCEADEWRGSGRSIEGFDLAAALRDCSHLLIRHGGHAMAAGLTIAAENLDAFRTHLNQRARRTLTTSQLQPALLLDKKVDLSELSLQSLTELNRLGPFGQGNPSIRLAACNLTMLAPPQRLGKLNQHVRFLVSDGTTSLQAIWWQVKDAPLPANSFDLAFEPQINEFNGKRSVQLKVLDWRPASSR